MERISLENLHRPLSYSDYRQLIDALLGENKTTGANHNEAMLQFTALNVSRMRRLDKTTRLENDVREALGAIDRPMIWLTLTEAWCGDAAQIVPVIEKMAQASPMVSHYLILRDENLPIMDAFLTNGARAIPQVVVLDGETNEVLGHWGPRPEEVQRQMQATKAAAEAAATPDGKKAIWDEFKKDSQKWYARDKTLSTQREFLATVREATDVVAA